MASSAGTKAHWSRRLAWIAAVLAVMVVAASSYLRLAGNGLGCDPWPQCYGTQVASLQAGEGAITLAVRAGHRVAASTFLVVAILAVGFGWSSWPRSQRQQGVLLLLVTFVLAAIGRYTPSALPWITWVNVLGGFVLIALALALALPRGEGVPPPRPSIWVMLLVVVLAAQVLGGTLLSVRLTAAECQPACAYAPAGDLAALWRPDRAGAATVVAGSLGGAALLHALHRVGGLVLALVALAIVAREKRGRHRCAGVVAGLLVVALGFAATHLANAVVGASHALAGALLLALLALRDRARPS